MRVLHISAGTEWGGAERALVTLARERRCAPGMHPHFAVCFRERLNQELRMAGSPVDYLGGVRVSRPGSVLRARRALKTVLAQERIDIAVCHWPWAHAIFAPVLWQAGVPIVFWMHGFAASRIWTRDWTEVWSLKKKPAQLIANSEATKATARFLFPKVPARVLHYAIFLQPEPRVEEPGTILQVSRMAPSKGHLLHLEALARLKRMPGWTCRFAGGAQTPSEVNYVLRLRKRVEALGIADRVSFLG
ncbi:MAG: glycosyltransferase, partial [Acidobacteriota bacterium]|nr:glycosyltransferase [Acidobacteriota bacterium]